MIYIIHVYTYINIQDVFEVIVQAGKEWFYIVVARDYNTWSINNLL